MSLNAPSVFTKAEQPLLSCLCLAPSSDQMTNVNTRFVAEKISVVYSFKTKRLIKTQSFENMSPLMRGTVSVLVLSTVRTVFNK